MMFLIKSTITYHIIKKHAYFCISNYMLRYGKINDGHKVAAEIGKRNESRWGANTACSLTLENYHRPT